MGCGTARETTDFLGKRGCHAKMREWNTEVRRNRGGDFNEVSFQWAGEGQSPCVQCEAVQTELLSEEAIVFTLAVPHVADERVVDVLEMAADLMGPSGLRDGFDEAIASRKIGAIDHLQRPDVCHGVYAGTAARCASDGVVNGQRRWCRASHECDVALVDPPGGAEESMERTRRFTIECKQQHAAGRPVKTVYGPDVLGKLIADATKYHVGRAVPSAVNRQSGRLVDRDQMLVSIEYLHDLVDLGVYATELPADECHKTQWFLPTVPVCAWSPRSPARCRDVARRGGARSEQRNIFQPGEHSCWEDSQARESVPT